MALAVAAEAEALVDELACVVVLALDEEVAAAREDDSLARAEARLEETEAVAETAREDEDVPYLQRFSSV